MALYKNSKFLKTSNSDAFDALLSPGTKCPNSGIYKCSGCGKEAACNKSDPLPPQNHHQHDMVQGKIQWQLIVYAQ